MSKENLSSDPRRSETVEKFVVPEIPDSFIATDEGLESIVTIVGLLCGTLTLIYKSKTAGWTGLACNVVAMMNQRSSQGSSSAGWSAVSFSLLGLAMLYSQMYFSPRGQSLFTRPSSAAPFPAT